MSNLVPSNRIIWMKHQRKDRATEHFMAHHIICSFPAETSHHIFRLSVPLEVYPRSDSIGFWFKTLC